MGGRVHDTREGVDLDDRAARLGGADFGSLDDRVAQQVADDVVELGVGEGGFDEVDPGRMHGIEGVAQITGPAKEGIGAWITRVRGRVDLDAMHDHIVAAGGV